MKWLNFMQINWIDLLTFSSEIEFFAIFKGGIEA